MRWLGLVGIVVVLAVVLMSGKKQVDAITPHHTDARHDQADEARKAVEGALQQGARRASEAMP